MSSDFLPLRIGPLTIEFPVVLAALAGYSDLPYRLMCRSRGGVQYCATEMMLDRILMLGEKVRRKMTLLATNEADHPLAGQIVGNDSRTMAQAAELLCSMGFDVVDLNFACPVRKALSRHRGGFMMNQPEQVLEIVRAVVAASSKPVTLKLRQKFRSSHSHDNFWQIAEGAFDAGVSAICVHARSVEVKYCGRADWQFLAEVKQHFPDKTIIGSGDVLTPELTLKMLRETKLDGAAVARGGLGNPWFFRQVRDLAAGREMYKPTLLEQRQVLMEHFEMANELYGLDKGPKIMRKFGIKYARLHPRPKDVRIAFVAVKRPADWQGVLDRFYSSDEPVGVQAV